MQEKYFSNISSELNVKSTQVQAAAQLFDQGSTVPFVARYRKEATGSLDEVQLTAIRDRLQQLAELDKRRQAILTSLEERDLLDDALRKTINGADSMTVLEDAYLPFRPKRRTKAAMAREKGLEPLADDILYIRSANPQQDARNYVDEEKGVASSDDALAGARDIIAETVNEDSSVRAALRTLFEQKAQLHAKLVKKAEKEKPDLAAKFKDYFDWQEPVAKAPGHRVLAVLRGENEGVLKVKFQPTEEQATHAVRHGFAMKKQQGPKHGGERACLEQIAQAMDDAYKRLLSPSMETELRQTLKARADEEAIRVFCDNVRELLLSPPLGGKSVLALDPGFRTGAKVVCLDANGKLLHHDVIYPTHSQAKVEQASAIVRELCARFNIQAIAIGNGTASRETESFVRSLNLDESIIVVMVNESGASIYSASEAARKEFPDHDVTVRGAVSIGRRLMDPLAELVKIDPKSIGVGQYQHDVDQSKLKQGLEDVVTSCVNNVGVELNTASEELLSYVSGLGPSLAKNIVTWRNENGAFPTRQALKKVARLGPKAFEQAAGFLRVRGSKNPLDSSAVHPESYGIVTKMAKDLGVAVGDLLTMPELRAKIHLESYITDKVGLPTLKDILAELEKPGRDPRETFEVFSFAKGIDKPADLEPGMRLPGIVTNVTKFGAFVDVGVHQDGLVHISQLADKFVKDPADVVKVGQKVNVTVLDVDLKRGRIGLSMRGE